MATATTSTLELVELKPSQLAPHKKNIRRSLGDLTTLAASIKTQGVQEPLLVAPNGKPDRYIIIAGHRRHAAAKDAGLKAVPCLINHALTEERDQIAAMLAENIERTDLTAVEESEGVQLLFDLGDNQKEISARTGMSAARVRSRIKVAKLSDDIKARITEHEVTLADAEFLADHASDDDDSAELERALGTNNWRMTKQRVIDREKERKRVAKVRKEIEAQGFDLVTDWGTRRQLQADAASAFGTEHHLVVTEQFPWPPPQVALDAALSDDTVAFVHASEYGITINGTICREVLVVFSAPKPTNAAEGTPSPDDGPTSEASDGESVTADAPARYEPTAEELAAAKRREDLAAATTVRRDFIKSLVVAGDSTVARRFGAVAAAALSRAHDFLDDDMIPRYEVFGVTPVEDPEPEARWMSVDRAAAFFAWLAECSNPHSQLIVYTLHYLLPLEHWASAMDPTTGGDPDLAAVVIDYLELLRECGHVLSDVEEETLTALRAELDEESSDEE